MKSLRPYAEAARLEGLLPDDLAPLREAMARVPELVAALNSAALSEDEKKELLAPLNLKPKVRNLVLLLARGRFMARFEELILILEELVLRPQGGVAGTLLTARPFDDATVKALEEATARRVGKKFVRLHPRVVPELKGGFLITADGVTFDRTLAGAVRDLASAMKEVN